MVKVLKSFKSAHEAVNWMSQNRIEDASIEMTGTLKSIGHSGSIPSGNYHVVLKARPMFGNPLHLLGKQPELSNDMAARVLDTEAQARAMDPNWGKGNKFVQGLTGGLAGGSGKLMTVGDDVLDPAEVGKKRKGEREAGAVTNVGEAAGTTMNPQRAVKENLRPGRVREIVDNLARMDERNQGGMDVRTSISREDLIKIITKSVIDVLKSNGDEPSEPSEPAEGTPEHYAQWLERLTSEDIRRLRVDKENPLVTYAEHFPEGLAEHVAKQPKGYDHEDFYDIYG
jgi:hypothetical protein